MVYFHNNYYQYYYVLLFENKTILWHYQQNIIIDVHWIRVSCPSCKIMHVAVIRSKHVLITHSGGEDSTSYWLRDGGHSMAEYHDPVFLFFVCYKQHIQRYAWGT